MGSPRTPCHYAYFVHAKVCAVARRSHGDLNERHEDAVGSQQQRGKSPGKRTMRSPRSPRGCRVHTAGTHMIATRTPLQAAAFARRPHVLPALSTTFALCLHRISFIPLRPLGDYPELPQRFIALRWRVHGVIRRLQGICSAITVRCEIPFAKENVIKASYYKSVAPIQNFRRCYSTDVWLRV